MPWADVDENVEIGVDLPDKEFVKTREAILLLFARVFPAGSSKWSSLDIVEHLVDETVDEVARIWRK